MTNRRVGRPLKYPHLLLALDDETVYSPGLILYNARDQKLLTPEQMEDFAITRVRIRHTMARLAANNNFPKEGDGIISLPGQSISVGWRGSRWKGQLDPYDLIRARDLMIERGGK